MDLIVKSSRYVHAHTSPFALTFSKAPGCVPQHRKYSCTLEDGGGGVTATRSQQRNNNRGGETTEKEINCELSDAF